MSTPRTAHASRQALTCTNLAWPDDPYGTGQVWRAKPQLLAGLATCCVDDGDQAMPVAHAVVYLRLHRTRPVDAADGFSFGFRAVAVPDAAGLPELLRLADLDVLRARRLAKVVAGCGLADDLHALTTAVAALRGAVPGAPGADQLGRGFNALAGEWPSRRTTAGGTALKLDVAYDIDGDSHGDADGGGAALLDLAAAADLDLGGVEHGVAPQHMIEHAAGLTELGLGRMPDLASTGGAPPPGEVLRQQAAEWLGACATERALLHALIAARHLNRYTWSAPVDVGAAVANCMSDCFPTQQFPLHAIRYGT